MSPHLRCAALSVLGLVLVPAAFPAEIVAPEAAADVSAVHQVAALLQSSLMAPLDAPSMSMSLVAPPVAAPAIDGLKAAAFLDRARAVGYAPFAAALPAAPALPSSAVQAASALPSAAAVVPQAVPPQERLAVLGAVSAALKDFPLEDIQKMSPEEVERAARGIADLVIGQRSSGAQAGPSRSESDRALVMDRLRKLSMPERARLGRFLGQAYDLLSGKGGPPVGKGASSIPEIKCLQPDEFDLSLQARRPSESGEDTPLAAEVQRLLGDSHGPDGFNEFVVTLALEAYMDLEAAGKIKTGERRVRLVDPHIHAEAGRDPNGVAHELVVVHALPIVPEKDLAAVIDQRLRRYGLDPGKIAAEFSGDPSRRYAHLLQVLYLADRLSQPRTNSFGDDVLPTFRKADGRFIDEYVLGGPIAQRSPRSSEHVGNIVRLLFGVD